MRKIEIKMTGITDLKTDAIVNAANSGLWAGSGVCGAIFKAAGYDDLENACKKIGHCDTGDAVITPGFASNAKYIIHAVGPQWSGGNHNEPEFLKTFASGSYNVQAVFANGTAETQITVENKPEPIGDLGDLDGDSAITLSDALTILRASTGLAELTPEQTKIADVDGDGMITSSDALAVLRFSAGLSDDENIGTPIFA